MQRIECLRRLAGLVRDEDLVVTCLGMTAGEWHSVRPKESNLYQINMGMTTPLCLGLALALPHRRVIALDSDGSIALMMGSLGTVGALKPGNLTIIVFDNESYFTTGGLPSITAEGTDLAAVAAACNIPSSVCVRELDAFAQEAQQALESDRCSVIVAKVEKAGKRIYTGMDGRENKSYFVRQIERTEGLRIINPFGKGKQN